MSAARLEAFLARLYTDDDLRARFLADPTGEAERAGLARADRDALVTVDREGLLLTAHSVAAKRSRRRRPWWRFGIA
jgi:hypothetical protein